MDLKKVFRISYFRLKAQRALFGKYYFGRLLLWPSNDGFKNNFPNLKDQENRTRNCIIS